MSTAVESHNLALRSVAYWLRLRGYTPTVLSKEPDKLILEGKGNTRSLLVQVKSAVQPGEPEKLTPDEERELIEQAAQLGCEPWEIRVQFDPPLRRAAMSEWRKLT